MREKEKKNEMGEEKKEKRNMAEKRRKKKKIKGAVSNRIITFPFVNFTRQQ